MKTYCREVGLNHRRGQPWIQLQLYYPNQLKLNYPLSPTILYYIRASSRLRLGLLRNCEGGNAADDHVIRRWKRRQDEVCLFESNTKYPKAVILVLRNCFGLF